ncbi:hypothetical protein KY290_028258 [Solanum tuberosum]|uniref:Uncharacterized protein n=1 Tax=Solanum tuberosum TaxID=4113 RepID=A0ABQ7UHD3_SOLTU|nr:hypothetical protein KY290_028258 [Solanum tuberosum]
MGLRLWKGLDMGLILLEGLIFRLPFWEGYDMPVIEHYSTLAARQGTPSLEWTATFEHDSERTRYGTDTDLVHGTDVVKETGHGTDLVGGTDLVEWTDLVGWIEHVEGLLLDNNLDDVH